MSTISVDSFTLTNLTPLHRVSWPGLDATLAGACTVPMLLAM